MQNYNIWIVLPKLFTTIVVRRGYSVFIGVRQEMSDIARQFFLPDTNNFKKHRNHKISSSEDH